MTTSDVAALSGREVRDVVVRWFDQFETALRVGDSRSAADLFLPSGYWRDILALTWDLRTFHRHDRIADGLATALQARQVLAVAVDGDPEVFERSGRGWSIEAFGHLRTDLGRGRLHLRLLIDPDDGTWKAWTLLSTLESLDGHEERTGHNRPKGPSPHLPSEPAGEEPAADDPQVLVLGAGQGGLATAARLRQLDVPTVVVERHPRIGDNWRRRYQSLVLHNEVWANHLPYLPFPPTFPVYIDKELLADWLEVYATAMELDVRTGTELVAASWDAAERRWHVRLRRPDGAHLDLRPAHLVLATGVFGGARTLHLEGQANFTGDVISAGQYDGDIAAAGRRALVIGSGSSAHDVAQDLHGRGADVTMLQRSSTCVVSVEPGAAKAYAIYAEDGVDVDDADLVSNAFPLALLAELHKDLTKRIAELDAELLEGLRAAGFALDFGEDNSGFLMKYHRYGGGYYIDVGCSKLIAKGEIAVKQGVEVDHLTATGAVFTDGSSMAVDLVVLAIGYENMVEGIRRLLGDAVADRVGPVWGLDEEGEVRNMWRWTGQPHLWLMGGSLQQVRPYSRYLALQVKGAVEGLVG